MRFLVNKKPGLLDFRIALTGNGHFEPRSKGSISKSGFWGYYLAYNSSTVINVCKLRKHCSLVFNYNFDVDLASIIRNRSEC